ncbi:riboflavin synthase [Hominifimenecus sp. rT4P-3]|uniref:riboflavin synthase n=1 Tax=Hominifimenecus sp. rT4P-3 TaxID=3242979 RepID=UPI003DA5156F
MFTGIVEEVGVVKQIQKGSKSAVLTIQAKAVLEGTKIGDSIAVNGVCLTVVSLGNGCFSADVMHETINRSSLARLICGSRVNLERAMAADGRFGGHLVAGHVDGVGKIVEVRQDDTAIWYTVQAEPSILRYIVEKGSIAIDGISLTVAQVFSDRFSISAIPHTVRMTVLKDRREGDEVNLENDMIGKYVEKLLRVDKDEANQSRITRDFLTQYGY